MLRGKSKGSLAEALGRERKRSQIDLIILKPLKNQVARRKKKGA